VLSGGRLEIGLGAGWLTSEYEQAGITFDPPSVRVDRLEEYVEILIGLMGDEPFTHDGTHFSITGLDGQPKPVQRPHPPILLGGGSPKILRMAGRLADIVSIVGSNSNGKMRLDAEDLSPSKLDQKLGWVREGAGDRYSDIELCLPLLGLHLAADPAAGAQQLATRWAPLGISADDIVASPSFATGTIEDICEQLLGTRDRFGINYFSVTAAAPDTVRPVIESLRGR
jgi:probable F420-dependent oxidoreductase